MSKKIEISANTLWHLYVDLDKTTYEIARMYNCHRQSISRLLKKYGIAVKRHKRAYSFYYEQKLNDEQKQLILGSLLGDGCIAKHHKGINSCRFVEQHSISQLEYLEWKKEILQNFVSNEIRIVDNSKNKSYGNGLSCNFSTVLHKEFADFYNQFYDNRIKRIPYFQLTPLSLAVWYFDDGSIARINQKGDFYSVQMHTEGYDDNSIKNLRQMLKRQFDIDTRLTATKGKYKVITMGHVDSNKLMRIISPFVVPCMSYKIKFSDNPVETQALQPGVSKLKCFDANTHSSLSHSEMMV
jgi:predicted DNA-binding protein YlxM (UPF0122 family)